LELEHLNFALRTSIANPTKAAEIAQFGAVWFPPPSMCR